jgi:hypothetical protein
MIEFISQYWPEIIAIFLSGGALFVSIQAWHKSRVIYDIARYKISKHSVGDSKTKEDLRHEKALKNALQTGKWEILHIYEKSDNTLIFVLGKIKK